MLLRPLPARLRIDTMFIEHPAHTLRDHCRIVRVDAIAAHPLGDRFLRAALVRADRGDAVGCGFEVYQPESFEGINGRQCGHEIEVCRAVKTGESLLGDAAEKRDAIL